MTDPITVPTTIDPAGDVVSHDIWRPLVSIGCVLMLGVVVYLMLRSDKRAAEDHERAKKFYDRMTHRWENESATDPHMNSHRHGTYDFEPQQAPNAQTDQM